MTERDTGPTTEPSPSPAVNVLNPAPSVLASASSDPLRLMRWALRDARHPKLTGTVRAVLGAIIDRFPDMRPSVPRIAADAGVSRATAFRALGDLRTLGVISSRPSVEGSQGVCSTYSVDVAAVVALKSGASKMTSKARPQKRTNPSQVATPPVSSCAGSPISDSPNPSHGETPPVSRCDAPRLTVRRPPSHGETQSSQEKGQEKGTREGNKIARVAAQSPVPGSLSSSTPSSMPTQETTNQKPTSEKTPAECRTVPMYPDVVPPCPLCGRVSHAPRSCEHPAPPVALPVVAPVSPVQPELQLALVPMAQTAAPAKRAPKVRAPKGLTDDDADKARAVFDEYMLHWTAKVNVGEAPKLDAALIKLITAALRKSTYENLIAAVRGLWADDFCVEKGHTGWRRLLDPANGNVSKYSGIWLRNKGAAPTADVGRFAAMRQRGGFTPEAERTIDSLFT